MAASFGFFFDVELIRTASGPSMACHASMASSRDIAAVTPSTRCHIGPNPRRHVWECTPLVSKADEEERYKSLKAAAKLAKNPATFWTFALKNRMSDLGVPLFRDGFTPSTRLVSRNDGMLRAGPRNTD